MPQITLHTSSDKTVHEYDSSHSLLSILQQLGFTVMAPCGGKGTCGKCLVKVKGIGQVTSCQYFPTEDIEVYLPTPRESEVLTGQHKYTLTPRIDKSANTFEIASPIGVAIDIGTTSVALYLVSLTDGHVLSATGKENSQGKYGADVISRISHCDTDGGLQQLQDAIVGDIKDLLDTKSKTLGIEKHNIVKVSVSANTTMLHLLMGVDPTSIALAPFKPTFTEEKLFNAAEMNLGINPKAMVHLLPSISAYVGADIVSGLAALNPPESIKNYLFVDVGTNGEIAVVTPDRILSCATAAGPAFEGANISCGMGAYPGAISAYDANSFKTINDEKPIGICGAGLFDAVAYMLDAGELGFEGTLSKPFPLVDQIEFCTGKAITLTPQDIREVQLAKSAIYSGLVSLLEQMRLSYDDIDAVFLAGGMGNYMNIKSAIRIGLFPQELKDKIIQVGNTSGAGAVLDVCSNDFGERVNSIIAKADHIDLADDPNFSLNFAMNTFFS